MPKVQFPPVDYADENGLLAIGGDYSMETLLCAYRLGIFPWTSSQSGPIAWFSPDPRGVLKIKNFHISRSLKKFIRQTTLKVTFNHCFSDVISQCAQVRKKEGTWITPDLIKGYCYLHEKRQAYSVEVWNKDRLVGGLYGVNLGQFISGESMFYLESHASKLALFSLVEFLSTQNIHWIDTQMVTPLVESFGGEYILREDFLDHLNMALKGPEITTWPS